MKTVPVTYALFQELSIIRDKTGNDEIKKAFTEAQKGFGPSIIDMARFREMVGLDTQTQAAQ